MEQGPPTPRRLLSLVAESLRSVLPREWSTSVEAGEAAADGIVAVTAPDGRRASLVVEAKSIFDARDVAAVQLQLHGADGQGTSLIAARYLSPRTREALSNAGISYVDATGNVRIAVDDPAIFVLHDGADRDPWRSPDRPTSSLRGKPAARIVRTLVDRAPPWRLRELAAAAATSLGSTARTGVLLSRAALVDRDATGAIVDVAWPALLERWAADYDLTKRRRTLGLVAPRGLDAIEPVLRQTDARYVVSGSLAAAQWVAYAPPRLALVYSGDADHLQSLLKLRVAPSHPNVILIEPESDYVYMRPVERDGVRYAAPSQVAVDLLAGPGRNPEEGRALVRWMQANERVWRAT